MTLTPHQKARRLMSDIVLEQIDVRKGYIDICELCDEHLETLSSFFFEADDCDFSFLTEEPKVSVALHRLIVTTEWEEIYDIGVFIKHQILRRYKTAIEDLLKEAVSEYMAEYHEEVRKKKHKDEI